MTILFGSVLLLVLETGRLGALDGTAAFLGAAFTLRGWLLRFFFGMTQVLQQLDLFSLALLHIGLLTDLEHPNDRGFGFVLRFITFRSVFLHVLHAGQLARHALTCFLLCCLRHFNAGGVGGAGCSALAVGCAMIVGVGRRHGDIGTGTGGEMGRIGGGGPRRGTKDLGEGFVGLRGRGFD